MSYTIDKIKAILQSLSQLVGDASPVVKIYALPDGQESAVLVRDGYTYREVAGEQEPRASHVFDSVSDFAAYLNRRAKPECADILVDSVGDACASFDPDSRSTTCVSYVGKYDPSFSDWTEAFRAPLSAKGLHGHLRKILYTFLPLEPGKDATLGEYLLQSLGSFKVSTGAEVQVEMDRTGMLRAMTRGATNDVSMDLPDVWPIRVPIFDGVMVLDDEEWIPAVYGFDVLLSMSVAGELKFSLSAPKLEQVKRQAVSDLVAWLRHNLDDGFLVGAGTFEQKSVPIGPREMNALPQGGAE